MPIYYGNNEIGNILNGSTGIGSVYYGNNQVWAKDTWYLKSLGTVTSYNCNSLGIDVSKLTADNFVARSQGTGVYGYCEKVYSSSATSNVRWEFVKSYSGGVINFKYHTISRNTDESTAMPLFLITQQKVSGATKISGKNRIYLGYGTSFNVASKYSGYKNLSADNFYFTTGGSVEVDDGPDVSGAGPVEGTGYVAKSYNASTGQLSFYNTNSYMNASLYVWLIV